MPQNKFHTLLTAAEATGVGGALANGRMTPAQIRTVDDASVIQADVEAENGVIHVIDRVLMPAA